MSAWVKVLFTAKATPPFVKIPFVVAVLRVYVKAEAACSASLTCNTVLAMTVIAASSSMVKPVLTPPVKVGAVLASSKPW